MGVQVQSGPTIGAPAVLGQTFSRDADALAAIKDTFCGTLALTAASPTMCIQAATDDASKKTVACKNALDLARAATADALAAIIPEYASPVTAGSSVNAPGLAKTGIARSALETAKTACSAARDAAASLAATSVVASQASVNAASVYEFVESARKIAAASASASAALTSCLISSAASPAPLPNDPAAARAQAKTDADTAATAATDAAIVAVAAAKTTADFSAKLAATKGGMKDFSFAATAAAAVVDFKTAATAAQTAAAAAVANPSTATTATSEAIKSAARAGHAAHLAAAAADEAIGNPQPFGNPYSVKSNWPKIVDLIPELASEKHCAGSSGLTTAPQKCWCYPRNKFTVARMGIKYITPTSGAVIKQENVTAKNRYDAASRCVAM